MTLLVAFQTILDFLVLLHLLLLMMMSYNKNDLDIILIVPTKTVNVVFTTKNVTYSAILFLDIMIK